MRLPIFTRFHKCVTGREDTRLMAASRIVCVWPSKASLLANAPQPQSLGCGWLPRSSFPPMGRLPNRHAHRRPGRSLPDCFLSGAETGRGACRSVQPITMMAAPSQRLPRLPKVTPGAYSASHPSTFSLRETVHIKKEKTGSTEATAPNCLRSNRIPALHSENGPVSSPVKGWP